MEQSAGGAGRVALDVLPPGLLDAADRGTARFYAGEHDAPFPGRTPYDSHEWGPEHGNALRGSDDSSCQVREIAQLTRSAPVGAIAARQTGATQIRLRHDQLLSMPAGLDSTAGNDGDGGVPDYTELAICLVL